MPPDKLVDNVLFDLFACDVRRNPQPRLDEGQAVFIATCVVCLRLRLQLRRWWWRGLGISSVAVSYRLDAGCNIPILRRGLWFVWHCLRLHRFRLRLRARWQRRQRLLLSRDKDDLVLACVEVIPDDDLVTVPLKRRARLGDEQIVIRLELREDTETRIYSNRRAQGSTLNDTMYPSRVHSSTKGFRILGTWSISMCRLPLPD